MHTKIWWSYVHIKYLLHVQKWTYLALGRPYGWAHAFKQKLSASRVSIASREIIPKNSLYVVKALTLR